MLAWREWHTTKISMNRKDQHRSIPMNFTKLNLVIVSLALLLSVGQPLGATVTTP